MAKEPRTALTQALTDEVAAIRADVLRDLNRSLWNDDGTSQAFRVAQLPRRARLLNHINGIQAIPWDHY